MSRSPPGRRALFLLGSIPLYGLELANIEVARSLRERGWDVLFLTNEHWGHQAINPRLDALGIPHAPAIFFGKMERGAGLRRWLTALRLQLTENLKLWRVLRRFRPEVIHVGMLEDFIAFLPSLILTRARVVFRAGTDPDASHRLLRLVWRAFVFPKVSSLVAVSHFIEGRFLAIGAQASRTRVIYNSVPDRPAGAPLEVPAANTVRFLYVGQIVRHKGVGELVRAAIQIFSKRADGELVLLGDTESDFASRLRDEVERAGLHDRIRFAGYVSDPRPWFEASSVHVCPSVTVEAFGIVVVEAKSAGLPSIVFPSGALPEIVSHELDGYVCSAPDSGELVSAMGTYLSDDSRIRRQGIAARESLKTLGIDRVDERWLEVFGA